MPYFLASAKMKGTDRTSFKCQMHKSGKVEKKVIFWRSKVPSAQQTWLSIKVNFLEKKVWGLSLKNWYFGGFSMWSIWW